MLYMLFTSSLFGLLYGGLGYLAFAVFEVPDALRKALIVGLSAFGLLLLMMQLNENRMQRRFDKARTLLPGQPQAMLRINMRQGRQISRVIACLYSGEICLLCVEKKEPVLTRLTPDVIRTVVLDPPVELRLLLTDGRLLMCLSAQAEELARHMRLMGCTVLRHEK